MANYFLKAATPCSCQRVCYFTPTTVALETWREIGKYDVSGPEIVERSLFRASFSTRIDHRADQIVRRGEPWSKKKLELEAARVVLIERMHLPIKLKKKLITILSECILIKESRRTMRGGI